MGEHKCNWDTVEWNKDYEIGGLGETLERYGKCKVCGKVFREVYLQSCVLDNGTDKEVDLTVE